MIRVLQFSRAFAAGQAVDVGIALSTAMQRLGVFCLANGANYARVVWSLDIDPPSNVLTFNFSCHVFPNTFASVTEAEAAGFQAGRTTLT
jgi:hypothetical protein